MINVKILLRKRIIVEKILNKLNTVATQNSDTPNSDIVQNSGALFALTKMSLF